MTYTGNQSAALDAVVDAYRIYQRMTDLGSLGLQIAAFKKYRMRAKSYHDAWGVWPRYATTRNVESSPKVSPEKLASMVIHNHLDNT